MMIMVRAILQVQGSPKRSNEAPLVGRVSTHPSLLTPSVTLDVDHVDSPKEEKSGQESQSPDGDIVFTSLCTGRRVEKKNTPDPVWFDRRKEKGTVSIVDSPCGR